MKKGFTLVELVIVIVIVGILSIVAVPIYRGYVDKARLTEGKALASAIRNAQMIYYAEHGTYYTSGNVAYNPVLMMDARGNKYFKTFNTSLSSRGDMWTATVNDSTNPGDWITIYWNRDTSSPVTIDGYKLPVFYLKIDDEYSYSNS